MKIMNLLCVAVIAILFMGGCRKNDESELLVGNPGNPRFNLQFTNQENVDLDLYVKTPSGSIIYYSNLYADGGTLDVDCLCGSCPNGPNENIYWENGTAPKGVYEYWVEYYEQCTYNGGEVKRSDYTLRVLKNSQVLVTKTGTLSGGETIRWQHTQD